MKKRKMLWSVICLMMLTLAGCGGGGGSTDGSNDGGGSGDGDNTLVVGMASDLKTLDPHHGYEVYGNMVYYAMYDYLYRSYDSSTPEASLAESHEMDDAQKVHTFKIKEGVKFSSGNDLTSKDVKFSVMRTKNLKSNTSHHTENVENIETPDDYTVKFTLKEPDAAFLVKLANNSFAILDSEVVKEHGGTDAEDASSKDTAEKWLNANSAGSGAYVLDKWKQNEELSLTKNDKYWGKVANDKVICKEIPDVNNQIQMLKQGDIDIALGIGVDNASQLKDQEGVKIKNYVGSTTTFLLMNQDEKIGGPMANPKVQEAVRKAINYEELLKISGDKAVLPLDIVPKGFVGGLEKEKDYQDLDEAKKLMEEAGYKDGFEVKFTVANFDTEGMSWTTLGQKIKDDLEKIGINAKIETSEIGVVIDSYREGKEAFLMMHWHPDYMDINNQLVFLPGDTVGERANWMDTSNTKMAELKQTIQTESDETKRKEASEELQKLLANDMPYAFLVQHPKVLAYRDNLKGVNYYEVQKINFQDVGIN